MCLEKIKAGTGWYVGWWTVFILTQDKKGENPFPVPVNTLSGVGEEVVGHFQDELKDFFFFFFFFQSSVIVGARFSLRV